MCCSYKSLDAEIFGFDTRDRKKETQVIPSLACSKDIFNHMASLGFLGPKDEVDLILSRVEIFTHPGNKFYDHLSLASREAWFWLKKGIKCEVQNARGIVHS